MDALILVCIILFWFMFILGMRHLYVYLQKKQELQTHLNESVANFEQSLRKKETLTSKVLKKVLKYGDDFSSIGQRVNFFSEEKDVEDWLRKSGNRLELTVERFQGVKIYLAFIGLVSGIILFIIQFPLSQFAVALFPVAGYFIPIILLKNQAKKRQEELRYDLPDFLDTVSVSLQAGIDLDKALREVIQFFDGPLREEFSRFLHEINLGVPREEAYRQLMERNSNPEFQNLIKSLIQGLKLGVPIATTFKIQADDMREIRKEQVKEKAAKASPKITLITTFIIAPTAMLLVGGLMVMNLLFGDNNIFDLVK
ncbi:pilus assembly protein TadB [[Bacillus] enclensis]|uniref:Tight adherence protein C n=1 Tax=[Bacillus] enclensis TaxID=1402860 RepID=A0A0V8H530_9BACI|nr:type II secretion system F family protein [[Bacillus] enclensis]KSU57610.1 pilus assembly protein TadB [[Bacillus] enclensis]SCC36992.1 tight adherence protein C [[Bacillus] enclensis]